MADFSTTSAASLLYEMKETLQENFPKEHVFLAEMSGVGDIDAIGRITPAQNRTAFHGKRVRVPVLKAPMQGGGNVSETGTINVPIAMDITEAWINLARVVQPFSLTFDVEEDTDNMDTSAAQAVALSVKQARQSLADIDNDEMVGNSGALLNNVNSSTGSGTLVIDVGTSANFDRLYPGRVVDILTRSNGANPGNGKRRLIASISEANGTITVSTTSQASDGDSGNVTFSSSEGVYIAGSYGNAITSVEDIAAVTGTFENIDKAAVAGWQGTDGRGGTTTTVPLSAPVMDGAVRRGRRSGVRAWDFGIGDPAVIDLYKQGLLSQVHYNPQDAQLMSGFKGIVYDGADKPIPLVKEPAHKKGAIKLINKSDLQFYGRAKGPTFLDDDGAMFRRFSRALPREAWLIDRIQLGAKRCSTLVFINNLSVAS